MKIKGNDRRALLDSFRLTDDSRFVWVCTHSKLAGDRIVFLHLYEFPKTRSTSATFFKNELFLKRKKTQVN